MVIVGRGSIRSAILYIAFVTAALSVSAHAQDGPSYERIPPRGSSAAAIRDRPVDTNRKIERADRFYFAPEVGYVLPTESKVDDSIFLGGRIGYRLRELGAPEGLSIEVEAGWIPYEVDNVQSGARANKSKLDVDTTLVLANLRYSDTFGCDRECKEDWSWYVFGGAGAAFNDGDDDVALDPDNSLAWQTGVGVATPEYHSLVGFVDVRYLWNDANMTDAAGDDVSLNSVMFTGGVKF